MSWPKTWEGLTLYIPMAVFINHNIQFASFIYPKKWSKFYEQLICFFHTNFPLWFFTYSFFSIVFYILVVSPIQIQMSKLNLWCLKYDLSNTDDNNHDLRFAPHEWHVNYMVTGSEVHRLTHFFNIWVKKLM